jgi:hypothetical protein
MKLYKDPANTVYAYEADGSQDAIIPADQVPITQEEADALRFPPMPPVIPQSVTMRQARLALLAQGLLPLIDAAIAAMPSPQKEAAQIEWQYSSTVERNKPLVQALGPALGLTDASLDQLFVTAAGL